MHAVSPVEASKPCLAMTLYATLGRNLCLLVQVLSNDGSGEFNMSQEVQNEVMHAVTSFGGQQALRCLALAYKTPSTAVNKVRLITAGLAVPEPCSQLACALLAHVTSPTSHLCTLSEQHASLMDNTCSLLL